MAKEKLSRKEGEVLFVASKETHLSVVLHAGGPLQMADGTWVNSKARYANFHPGSLGGEFRTSDPNVISRLRELDGQDQHFTEVTSESQLSELARLRDKLVADKGPTVRVGARNSVDRPINARIESEPSARKEAIALAARGPDEF